MENDRLESKVGYALCECAKRPRRAKHKIPSRNQEARRDESVLLSGAREYRTQWGRETAYDCNNGRSDPRPIQLTAHIMRRIPPFF